MKNIIKMKKSNTTAKRLFSLSSWHLAFPKAHKTEMNFFITIVSLLLFLNETTPPPPQSTQQTHYKARLISLNFNRTKW